MNTQPPVLKITGLTKHYGGVHALEDANFVLHEADAGRSPCPGVRELLDRRLADIAAQRRALARAAHAPTTS